MSNDDVMTPVPAQPSLPAEASSTAPDVQTAAGEDSPPPTAPAVVPPPDVSREDHDLLARRMDELAGNVNQIVGAVSQLATRTAAPAAAVPEITDEQLAAMMESGDAAQMVRANRLIAAQTEQRIVAQMQRERAETIAVAAPIAERVARADMPHYDEFKREIDDVLAGMPAEARVNLQARLLAHNFVVAQPQNMKKIVEREVESRMRQQAAQVQASAPAGPAGRTEEALPDGIPSYEELFPDSPLRPGTTADDHVRRLGYENWVDFIKRTDIPEGEGT